MAPTRFARANRWLVVYDQSGRIWLLVVAAVTTASLFALTYAAISIRLSTNSLLVVGVGLAISVLLHVLAAWWDMQPRLRRLRELIATGMEVPATFNGVAWSDDPASHWGESVWTYEFAGRRYEARAAESIYTKLLTDARVLLDPAHPENALVVRPNGILRGGPPLSRPLGRVILVCVALGLGWLVAAATVLAIVVAPTR